MQDGVPVKPAGNTAAFGHKGFDSSVCERKKGKWDWAGPHKIKRLSVFIRFRRSEESPACQWIEQCLVRRAAQRVFME